MYIHVYITVLWVFINSMLSETIAKLILICHNLLYKYTKGLDTSSCNLENLSYVQDTSCHSYYQTDKSLE